MNVDVDCADGCDSTGRVCDDDLLVVRMIDADISSCACEIEFIQFLACFSLCRFTRIFIRG